MAEDVETAIPQEIDPHRYAEMAWIGEHAMEYRGEWVAVQGGVFLSHGLDLDLVAAAAERKGVRRPLFYHVPRDFGEPRIGYF